MLVVPAQNLQKVATITHQPERTQQPGCMRAWVALIHMLSCCEVTRITKSKAVNFET